MSDRIVQSYHEMSEIPEKSVKPCESDWMAHWKGKSCMSANEAHNQLSPSYVLRKDGHNTKHQRSLSEPEIEIDSSTFVKGFREATKTSMINTTDESLVTSPKKLRRETFQGQSFPVFKSSQYSKSIVAPTNGESSSHHEEIVRLNVGPNSGYDVSFSRIDSHLPVMLSCAPSETETQSRESLFQPEEVTRNSEPQVKFNKLLEKKNLGVSQHLLDDFLRSTSESGPCEFNRRKPFTQSMSCRQDDTNQPQAAFFIHEKKNNNAALLICDPSTSNIQLKDFVAKRSQKMPNQSDLDLFASEISPREMIKFEKLYHGSYALPRMQSSVHDVKTKRICTTIDSVQEFPKCLPEFSQTTHHSLITKSNDVNLSDGGQTLGGLLNLSPDFGFHVKQGVKLQPLDSLTESEGKVKIDNLKGSAVDLRNESLAETDTMDMDAVCQNHPSGFSSSTSYKENNGSQKSPAFQTVIHSIREEVKGRFLNTELPDINQELPVLPNGASSADDRETSTSRTQSLDVEHILSNAEHPVNSKSNDFPDDSFGLDPFCRWVKRLKPSASDSFAHGMKSSRMGEASSHEKTSKLLSKMLKCSKISLEPKAIESCGKEQLVTDQNAELMRNAECSSTDSVRKNQVITLSHSWFQRWCRTPSASPIKKSEAVVDCEPKSSKAILDLQKKQFPSIAAMALMGKAMTGFRPCEFQKRGSLVIWY